MDIDALVEEVLRLDAEASKGPWRNGGTDVFEDGGETEWVVETDDELIATIPTGGPYSARNSDPDVAKRKPDTDLIASYRTACPTLARELRRVREEVVAYEAVVRAATRLFVSRGPNADGFARVGSLHLDDVRSALAAVDRVKRRSPPPAAGGEVRDA